MQNNYMCYHLHSWDSLLDSCTDWHDYIDYAAELGQSAIGFSEHGNIYNWFAKKQYAESKGLKYLHGIECYLTERFKDPNNKDDKNIRDNYHTILIARDYEGFVELNNLFLLSSRPDHFYYKRRLSFDEFFNISDHIIKISACVMSPLNKYRKVVKERGITDQDKITLKKLLQHYDYYEIQMHPMQEQIEYNQYLYKMSKRFNKPLIVGVDAHNLNQYKAECRTILQYGKTDGAWGDEENTCDLTYQTFNELIEGFKKQNSLPMDVVLEAIDETNKMANSVEEIVLDTHNKYPILYGNKDEEVLWSIIKKNYKYKRKHGIISDDMRYVDNIKEEMRVFKKVDMIGFMLLMSEIMTWAKDNHIATGFARGSVAGSTVAYITNITDVDPVKWNTVFSRFCNESRIEAGDVDTDWFEDDRQKIYDYIINRFGKEKTAYILAMTTLADKSVIDVIGKAFRVKAEKENTSTIYTLDKIKEIKDEYENNPEETKNKYSDLFYYYDGLANCVVAQSQHPAGIIVSSDILKDTCGGFYGSDGQIILPIDMDECHNYGQNKYDILGLKSIGVIDKTYKALGKNFPKADEIDWNDQAVFKDISDDSTGIFQFESDFAHQSIKKMQPRSIQDLSLASACLRPSGETYREDVFAHKIHKNPSKLIDDILKDSAGQLVYQEQTIAFLQQVCGFSGSEADTVRRAIGRKKEAEVKAALPKILDGYCAKSDKPRKVAEQEAKDFLEVINLSSSYQFGFNHACSYSMLSYVMGYLRYYYPTEFCTAYLNCAKNDDDITNGTKIALDRGCKIVPPTFGHSIGEYSCDGKQKIIYKGLASIKYMSTDVANELYALKDIEYPTFVDLLIDVHNKTSLNSRQLDILTRLSFFEHWGNSNYLLTVIEWFNKLYGKKQLSRTKLEEMGISWSIIERNAEKINDKTVKFSDATQLIKDIVTSYEIPRMNPLDQIRNDIELLGYSNRVIDDAPPDNWMVIWVDPKYHNVIEMYRLYNGETKKIKIVRSKVNVPLVGNEIIRPIEYTERFKKRKVGTDPKTGKVLFEDTTEKEIVLSRYKVLT